MMVSIPTPPEVPVREHTNSGRGLRRPTEPGRRDELAHAIRADRVGMAGYNPYTGEYDDTPDTVGSPYTPIYTPEPGGLEIPEVDASTYLNPGTYYTSGGRSVQFGGGSSDALARMLSPVIPGVLNIITGMYQPPAYETVTGPGGSRTTIRVPGTVAGQPQQVIPGINTNTIMIVAAVAVVMLMVNRGR